MTPLAKFNTIVLTITSIIVFYLLGVISNITESHPNFKIPLAALSTVGVYNIFVFILKILILRIRFIKKLVFGAYYLEGVWVGFFIGESNKERYYIETFEQDFDSLVIRGKAFKEDKGYFASWISESSNIDAKKGILNYTYQTNPIKNTFINSGLANFEFERKRIDAAPHKLIGFSSDLYSSKKLKSMEEKINDKPYIEDLNIALKKAKKFIMRMNTFGSN